MELWDTITNIITSVPHPPGYEMKRFFRPTITPLNDDTILFSSSKTYFENEDGSTGDGYLSDIFTFNSEKGWKRLGINPYPQNTFEQVETYPLTNPSLGAFKSLNRCAY